MTEPSGISGAHLLRDARMCLKSKSNVNFEDKWVSMGMGMGLGVSLNKATNLISEVLKNCFKFQYPFKCAQIFIIRKLFLPTR